MAVFDSICAALVSWFSVEEKAPTSEANNERQRRSLRRSSAIVFAFPFFREDVNSMQIIHCCAAICTRLCGCFDVRHVVAELASVSQMFDGDLVGRFPSATRSGGARASALFQDAKVSEREHVEDFAKVEMEKWTRSGSWIASPRLAARGRPMRRRRHARAAPLVSTTLDPWRLQILDSRNFGEGVPRVVVARGPPGQRHSRHVVPDGTTTKAQGSWC